MRRPGGSAILAAAGSAALLLSGMAQAQTSQLDPGALGARPMTAPQPQQDADAAPAIPRTITLEAGTGMLLRLPQPAATVLSAEPGVAAVQPASATSLFLMGVAPGRTTVIATSDTGVPIGQFDVIVTSGQGNAGPAGKGRALGSASGREVENAVHRVVPGARGVIADVAGGKLLLRGAVTTAVAAQQVEAIARGIVGESTTIIDTMSVLSGVQVNVRVRIAEIDRTITRMLGFNWQALGNTGSWQFGIMLGGAVNANTTATGAILGNGTGIGGLAGATLSGVPLSILRPGIPAGIPGFQGSPAPNQLGVGFNAGGYNVNNIIDALAADGLVTILAEPNLTALSGETASFLAGGEFPVVTPSSSTGGIPTIATTYKPYGVSLALVPTVLSPTRLNLRVRPEVSQLSTNGAISVPYGTGVLTIPALTVRRAETTLELGSGQSFAMAGLLERQSAQTTNALPGLGELPVIGALFKSDAFQRAESELVIIVTPYLVRAVSDPENIHLPTDGFRPPNDADRLLYGRQIATQPPQPPLNAGFILK